MYGGREYGASSRHLMMIDILGPHIALHSAVTAASPRPVGLLLRANHITIWFPSTIVGVWKEGVGCGGPPRWRHDDVTTCDVIVTSSDAS